ncbi:hypothetical protein [Pseudomonas sp. LFS044]|jgi:MFS family permease|uniref:hypothetical protein n=1 Tax=Pseudomonas sp. LFS044 TaxID=3229880 RepID=UPI003A7FA793
MPRFVSDTVCRQASSLSISDDVYALTPSLYSTEQRVTALGWGIGIGRVGAIISPLVAGRLIDANWKSAELYVLFALAFVLAAMAVWMMKSHPVWFAAS